MKLYRPVGLYEMKIILETDCKAFPPRQKQQPYFYPVLNKSYAVSYTHLDVYKRQG